jgi:hypothetical protein
MTASHGDMLKSVLAMAITAALGALLIVFTHGTSSDGAVRQKATEKHSTASHEGAPVQDSSDAHQGQEQK